MYLISKTTRPHFIGSRRVTGIVLENIIVWSFCHDGVSRVTDRLLRMAAFRHSYFHLLKLAAPLGASPGEVLHDASGHPMGSLCVQELALPVGARADSGKVL